MVQCLAWSLHLLVGIHWIPLLPPTVQRHRVRLFGDFKLHFELECECLFVPLVNPPSRLVSAGIGSSPHDPNRISDKYNGWMILCPKVAVLNYSGNTKVGSHNSANVPLQTLDETRSRPPPVRDLSLHPRMTTKGEEQLSGLEVHVWKSWSALWTGWSIVGQVTWRHFY